MTNSPLGTVLNRLRTLLEPEDADATDRELLRRFVARREEAAFGELVRRHGPMILGVCRRILGDAHAAEDAFQATFLVLVRRARAVPWRESLGGWLHGTARRVALRARRAAGVSRLIAAGSAGSRRPLADPDPSEEAAARELRRVLDQELQGLPAKYRAPLVLCDLEGKTHEQAARELGWPKGSLAKRLNGGRERLRARLVRRGVVPAAETNELAPAPPAALTAAAMLSAHGGASTKATALAKGVIQAMWLARINMVFVVLTLALAGTVVGVELYRTWPARAAAPAPAPNPAHRTGEDTEAMPIDKAAVYHISPILEPPPPDELWEQAWVVSERPEDLKGNIRLLKSASRAVPAGPNLAILAVGPVLDSSDSVVVAGLTRHGDKLELVMTYTSAVFERKLPKPNAPWRPLVQVPIKLNAGRYTLTVPWQVHFRVTPAGFAQNEITVTARQDFAVTSGGRKESKPTRVNGAEFTAFATAECIAPVIGATRDLDLGLRIVNVSDKEEVFRVANIDAASLSFSPQDALQWAQTTSMALSMQDGKTMQCRYEHSGSRPAGAVSLAAGKDATIPYFAAPYNGRLAWSDDGKTMRLSGTDDSGTRWWFDGLRPGKYLLTVEYENTKASAFWQGMVKTEPVESNRSCAAARTPNTSK